MGDAQNERDKREKVGIIRGDVRAIFTHANVSVSRFARPVRLTFHVSRFTGL